MRSKGARFLRSGSEVHRKERPMRRTPTLALVTGIASLFVTFASSPMKANAAEILPLPPDGAHFGMKLADWQVAWWQWIMSIPKSASPLLDLDKTGLRAGVGQRTPVWFLPAGSTPGVVVERTFTIPEGQAILFMAGGVIGTIAPGVRSEEELLDLSPELLERLSKPPEVSLDGVLIPNMKQYRVKTPVFSVTLAPGNLSDTPVSAGKDARDVGAAEGYTLLFPPLPLGEHVLALRSEGVDSGGKPIITQATYRLRIQKPNDPIP
jgi:hypothetical protein